VQQHQGVYKGDEGEAVRIYVEAEQNNAASERCGRPIYDEILYAEVTAPGQKESSPVFVLERKWADEVGIEQPYRSEKYEQYKKLIDAYRNGTETVDVRGTPLAAWPALTVSLVASYHAAGVYTVEALALLPDSRLAALGPGALSLRERAKAFVEAAAGNAPTEALAAENAQLKADLADLNERMKALAASLEAAQRSQTIPATPVAVVDPSAALQALADENAAKPVEQKAPAKKGGGNSII
jgi:hypothetical protein